MLLINPVQAHKLIMDVWQAVKPWLVAGHRLVIEVRAEKRSDAQNRRLWAMLGDVSRQVVWHGQTLSAEDWKHMFTASLKRQRVAPAIDGNGFVVLGQSTSKMTKSEMAELQTLIEAFGAERGVRFTAVEYD